jgi:hypothetical protein
VVAGLHEVQRRSKSTNLATQWAISAEPAHPALVSEADFIRVQQIHTTPAPADGSTREYALTALVFWGICGRALDARPGGLSLPEWPQQCPLIRFRAAAHPVSP